MKVGGGLNFVTGPMGSGKSLFAVRRLVAHITEGGYVITNVELVGDWADRVARHVMPWGSTAKRDQLATRFEYLYIFERELSEARKYRVPGKGEARAAFIWDEGHNDLNNRKWKDDGRAELLEWATQLRKLGLVGYLLTQHSDNTDAALRRIANYHIKLQNQREQTRFMGIRVSPWPLFLAYWYPAHLGQHGAKVVADRVDRYFLSWHRNLYDTMGLFHGLVDAEEVSALDLRHLPALPPRGRALARRAKALPAGDGQIIDVEKSGEGGRSTAPPLIHPEILARGETGT